MYGCESWTIKKAERQRIDAFELCWRGTGFPDSSVGKESACNVGDLGSIPRLGRSPGEGKGYPLQYSGLENSMDRSFIYLFYILIKLHYTKDLSNQALSLGQD